MKRIAALLLVLALLLPCLGMADTLWYCPKCGRPNNDNFCPTDGTARPATGASNATALTYSDYAYEPALPQDLLMGACTLLRSTAAYYGPGPAYSLMKNSVPAGTSAQIYGLEFGGDDDYLLVEFYDAFQGCSRRAWVPLGSVSSCTFY